MVLAIAIERILDKKTGHLRGKGGGKKNFKNPCCFYKGDCEESQQLFLTCGWWETRNKTHYPRKGEEKRRTLGKRFGPIDVFPARRECRGELEEHDHSW